MLYDDDLEPVEQGRFFEPIKAAERRRDPIAAFEHLAGDLCVTRLVGPDQRNRQPEKIDKDRSRTANTIQTNPL